MKPVTRKIFISLFLLSFIPLSAQAADGVIHFRGSLVEDSHQAALQCVQAAREKTGSYHCNDLRGTQVTSWVSDKPLPRERVVLRTIHLHYD